MRRIFSYKVAAVYLFLSIIFAVFVLTIGEPNTFFAKILYILSFALSGCFLVLVFACPNYILFRLDAGNVEIINTPILSTNKTQERYGSLIRFNNSLFVEEVEKIEIVTLSSAQKRQHIGHPHLFSKYLKVYMKHSTSNKYIYVSIYSKSQIAKIIKLLTASKGTK